MHRAWVFFLIIVFAFPLSLSAQTLSLTDAQWAASRSAARLVRLPAFGELMVALERQTDAALVVRHGNGDAALRRAEEMKSWLVTLGVPGAQVVLERDAALAGVTVIEARSGVRP
jgi:hypothetical protein